MHMRPAPPGGDATTPRPQDAKRLGVTIEAQYTVGEYDIAILSAHESDGLVTWLNENGYKIPAGAADVLGSYIKQKMRFFVAKVNLGEQEKLGVHLSAAAAGRLRVAEVHAADPARHGERGRPAGAVRLRAHAQGPGRDHATTAPSSCPATSISRPS